MRSESFRSSAPERLDILRLRVQFPAQPVETESACLDVVKSKMRVEYTGLPRVPLPCTLPLRIPFTA